MISSLSISLHKLQENGLFPFEPRDIVKIRIDKEKNRLIIEKIIEKVE